MLYSFYVDLISGKNSRTQAHALFQKMSDRMMQGRSNLRLWLINDAKIRAEILMSNDAERDCVGENTEENLCQNILRYTCRY